MVSEERMDAIAGSLSDDLVEGASELATVLVKVCKVGAVEKVLPSSPDFEVETTLDGKVIKAKVSVSFISDTSKSGSVVVVNGEIKS